MENDNPDGTHDITWVELALAFEDTQRTLIPPVHQGAEEKQAKERG